MTFFLTHFSSHLFRNDESADKNGKLDEESKPNKSENSAGSDKEEDKSENSIRNDKQTKTRNGKSIKGGDKVKSKVVENGNDLSNLTV